MRPMRHLQGGFFLIEAMVAILIFALGILGLVAMGGTAVSSQSDAQYRTEASNIADAIAGEIALGLDRTGCTPTAPSAVCEANKRTSRLGSAHQPNPPPTTAPAPCAFTGGPVLDVVSAPTVFPLLNRAANGTALPGMPGATAANQQIFIDAAGNFNRVVITLCWKTSSDLAWRRHTLVTYVN
jgi:type IV pilus assembly protein PilV